MNISRITNRTIKLSYRASSKVSGICVRLFTSREIIINFLEIMLMNNCLAHHTQEAIIRNRQRDILKSLCIVSNVLTSVSIATSRCLNQLAIIVNQFDSQTIILIHQQAFVISHKLYKFINILCLIQREQRNIMRNLFKFALYIVTNSAGW